MNEVTLSSDSVEHKVKEKGIDLEELETTTSHFLSREITDVVSLLQREVWIPEESDGYC